MLIYLSSPSPLYGPNVLVINVKTHSVIASISVGVIPFRLAFTPNCKVLYVLDESADTIFIFNVNTHSLIASTPFEKAPLCIAFTPDSKLAYVTCINGTVPVIDVKTHSIIANVPVRFPKCIAITPESKLAYGVTD
ncbi:YncE family protein [Bacillus sp. SCS-151]|uniref:YncE family protein n=1 Tax=Nanhaiella sioensis TaxID=3115293 RepID=UPI00397CD5F8